MRNLYEEPMICEEICMSREEFERHHVNTYEVTYEVYNEGHPITRKIIVLAYSVIEAINALCEDEREHVTHVRQSPVMVIDATKHSF